MTNTTRPAPFAPERDLVHPLEKLKGVIRRFLVYDVILFAALFLTFWFWLGLAFDYGLFKATGIDLAQQVTPLLRVGVFAVLAGVLVLLVVLRARTLLKTELSLSSLALILEKRYPKVLGDRLITAVEMADVDKAARQGYSADLVRNTIKEARERIGQVDVGRVFNWRRLWVKGVLAVVVSVLGLAVAVLAHSVATNTRDLPRAAHKFTDVASIWGERNVLMWNTPWPRRALVQIVEFDDEGHAGELRVGKGAAVNPKVYARACKWVVVDRTDPDGWRPLQLDDLQAYCDYRFATNLPGQTLVDDLELTRSDDPAVKDLLAHLEGVVDDLKNTRRVRKLIVPDDLTMRYDGLTTRAKMALTLTREASGKYAGELTSLAESMRFSVAAEDFVTARRTIAVVPPPALAELYRDEYQPAYLHHASPALLDADRDPKGELARTTPLAVSTPQYALRGVRQKFAGKRINISSDKSLFTVPVGTEVAITAVSDKPLQGVEIRPTVPGQPLPTLTVLASGDKELPVRDRLTPFVTALGGTVSAGISPQFVMVQARLEARMRSNKNPELKARFMQAGRLVDEPFDRITVTYQGANAIRQVDKATEFQLVMTDTDNVTSTRTIAVQATDDAPPSVDVLVDPVVRKVGGFYFVTPIALLPFQADSKVSDDTGLSAVRFEFRKVEEESASVVVARAVSAATFTAMASGPVNGWGMPAAVAFNQRLFALQFGSTVTKDGSAADQLPGGSVPAFARNADGDALGSYDQLTRHSLAQVRGWAANGLPADWNPQERPQVVKVVKLTDPFDFRRWMPELLVKEAGGVQQRYRVEVFVVAKDANVELTNKDGTPGEPKTARNLDPIRVMVVSEQDLLAEIGKDEEQQMTRMEDTMKKATDARAKLSKEAALLVTPDANQIQSSQVRATDIIQDVNKARDILTVMRTEYDKLKQELAFNRCADNVQAKYENKNRDGYLDILKDVLDDHLPKCDKSLGGFQGALAAGRKPTDEEATAARADLETLLFHLARLEAQIGIGRDINRSREALKRIIDEQVATGKGIDEERKRLETAIYRPRVSVPKVVPVAAGKSAAAKVSVEWRLYDKDEIYVAVETPTESDLKVAKEFTVKSNGGEETTTYNLDVTAGTKPGLYTIKLLPGPFKPGEPIKPVELTIEVTK